MKSLRPLVIFLVLVPCTALVAWAEADEDGIREAVLNYANALYLVQPELVRQSVRPELQKVGYALRGEATEYREHWMSFEQLEALAAKWNQDGRVDPETARREVKVLDRLDRIAVARLDAEWGVDFFHLAKVEGEWKIVNVIWQTHPPEAPADAD